MRCDSEKKKQKENSVVFDYLHGIFDSQDAPALTCTGKLYENLLLAYFYIFSCLKDFQSSSFDGRVWV